MNIQDLLNQYIPAALQGRFVEEEAKLLASLGKELAKEEVELVVHTALEFLGIPQANTPHVTNVAPEDLPPAVPVFAQPVVEAPVAAVDEREQHRTAQILELKAKLAELEDAPDQVA